ncbi:MAG: Maf family protein [Acutalibacteraceae bacterium]
MKPRFIVASASPRRKKLLQNMGFVFDVIPSDADETLEENISAADAVAELSKRKAQSVSKNNKGAVVLGCDTVVALGEKILTKPSNEKEAFAMLRSLSGKKHCVYSGVFITDGEKETSFTEKAEVEFYQLSDEEIKAYIATGEPMDKAGAYGIQGYGGALVKKINGDYYSIVGLPLARCIRELANFGVYSEICKNGIDK